MIKLRLFSALREIAGAKEVEVEGSELTIGEALQQFAQRFGEKAQQVLFDKDGQLQQSVLLSLHAFFLRELGFYLIEMNSGRLRGGSRRYRELLHQGEAPGVRESQHVTVALVGAVAAWSPKVSAQEEAPSETTYDFDDDLVTGDLVRPDGEQLVVRRRGRRTSLITIREHFIPEMLKSVEDL